MKPTNRLLSVLMAVALLFGLFAMTAAPAQAQDDPEENPSAAETVTEPTAEADGDEDAVYPLWLGGTQVTESNQGDILGDGKAQYDPASRTLTLADPAIPDQYESYYQIYAEGIDLTVRGSVALDPQYGGVYVKCGSLTIEGDLTASGPAYGIYADQAITILRGTVTAKGSAGVGISAPRISVDNGITSLTADGAEAAVRSDALSLGDKLIIREPADGTSDGKQILESDGATVAAHARIAPEEASACTVSFDTCGGPAVESQSVPVGGTATRPADPSLEGYTFEDWYLDPATDAEPYDFDAPVTEDLTLKAKWTTTVSASVKDTDGNTGVGGTVSLGDEDYDASKSASIWRDGDGFQVVCKADTGYSFDHWEDGDGNALAETGTELSFPANEGPKTFVAVFRREGFLVTFNGNGGIPAAQRLVTDADGRLDAAALSGAGAAVTRTGYDLTGWSRTPGGAAFAIGEEVFTADTTVYAVWIPRTYTVRFEVFGGSEVPAQYVTYGGMAYEPDDEPTRKGYAFDCWCADEAGTVVYDFSTTIKADTTIYAKWNKIAQYKVTSGGNSIYGKTSGAELEIVVKRDPKDEECFKHFTGVKIDGGALKKDTDYTAAPGSTVITIKPEVLGKLNTGSHIITVTFDDGDVITGLTVKAGSAGGAGYGGGPDTGDPGEPMLWAALLILSGLGLSALVVQKVRK